MKRPSCSWFSWRKSSSSEFRVREPLIDRLLPNVLVHAGCRTGIIGKLQVHPEKSFAFASRSSDNPEASRNAEDRRRLAEYPLRAPGARSFSSRS